MAAKNTASTLAKIRAATIGARPVFRSTIVEVAPEVEVEVRSLSRGAKDEVDKRARKISYKQTGDGVDVDVDFDFNVYQYEILLASCFVPGTDEPVFSRQDIDEFKHQPADRNHWSTRLLEAAVELNKAGNYETTPNESGS
jgi:hypothetical protein